MLKIRENKLERDNNKMEAGIFQKIVEQKFEPINDNGKIVSLKTIPQELYGYIQKLVTGIGYYANRHYYLEQIEKIATDNGLSLYTVGLLIKQAARSAAVPERTIYRMLPDKYKNKAEVEIEQSTSQSLPLAEIHHKKPTEQTSSSSSSKQTTLAQPENQEPEVIEAKILHKHIIKIDGKSWNNIIKRYAATDKDWFMEIEGFEDSDMEIKGCYNSKIKID